MMGLPGRIVYRRYFIINFGLFCFALYLENFIYLKKKIFAIMDSDIKSPDCGVRGAVSRGKTIPILDWEIRRVKQKRKT
ncbi:hypothetical protein D3Z45_06825 [Lachnospiraceae bacterium]|nr:hypothetical protein [Lachnospiraceae bacterium]